MKKTSVEQVEPRLAQELETPYKTTLKKLGYSIPENFRLRVSLLQANRRKKRSNAGADTWAPESERIEFWLEPSKEEKMPSPAEVSVVLAVPREAQADASQKAGGLYVHPAEAELLRALDRAESTPGWSFVALKKFRDEILPAADAPSIRTDVERHNVISSAIDKRFILTGKAQNPKAPQFPVTSIRLNRLMPQVQEVLGLPRKDLGFHPIHIKGEPLSATILRERR